MSARAPTERRSPALIDERDERRVSIRRRRAGRRLRQSIERALSALGLRRTIVVDGVRYRERTRDPLRRALTRAGGGVKEYDVRFPPGAGRTRATMRIRCTPERMYADVGPTRRPGLYERLHYQIRPGVRIFELGCSTGAGSAALSRLVGPSGGVVSVDRDRESVRFARQRYRAAQLGFEIGWHETLSGELDGAFDAVVAVDPLGRGEHADTEVAGELWRVVAPGGVLAVFQRVGAAFDRERALAAIARALGSDADDAHAQDAGDDTVMIRVRRPAPDQGPLTGDRGGDRGRDPDRDRGPGPGYAPPDA